MAYTPKPAGKYHRYDGDPPESEPILLDRQEGNRGRHLAQIACAECHGGQFEGNPEMGAPALAIAKAYSRDQFTRLLHTGITMAGMESRTGLMTEAFPQLLRLALCLPIARPASAAVEPSVASPTRVNGEMDAESTPGAAPRRR